MALKWAVGSPTSAENFLLSGGADGTMQLRKLSSDKVCASNSKVSRFYRNESVPLFDSGQTCF